MELDKNYTPQIIENKWYQFWEEQGFFKPSNNGNQSYTIMMPPPNVTGTLHMGHGFQLTIQDALIRYHRMCGYNTLWQVGTDHAGIATQMVVERQLEANNIKRADLGREAFVKKIWEWKELSSNTITRQMRKMGASCDWSRERFTMDDGLSKAVVEVFVTLYEKGYIYKGKRLVNWDVALQTAVSDLEVIPTEENGSLWYIRYNVENSDEYLVVATTRPETMLGDVAVAVNPNDARYQHLIGKMLILPLVGRQIPIIADDYVDVEFGTGCVKITPAHDFNDYELGKRHNLESISILDSKGYINENAPLKYQGIERFKARTKIIADLTELDCLLEVKAHKLMAPRGEKSNSILEPMLTEQWYVRMQKFALDAKKLVADKKIQFVPENWEHVYNQWLDNIQDWCISRQLWWGHRIPVYYDSLGKEYVARSFEEACQMANTCAIVQDEDVLDTWFSSALWCFSTLGWPEDTPQLQTFLPTNVLVTGFDIIFFWVARMVMFTYEFTGLVPFKEVMITGLIQDAHGNKMSKSKGNVIDPIDLVDGITLDNLIVKRTQNLMNPKQASMIAKQTMKDYPQGFMAYGVDALRFTFASLATVGREIRFDVRRLDSARNFCNKLWNATRFVVMGIIKDQALLVDWIFTPENIKEEGGIIANAPLHLIDKWILLSLDKLIADVEFAYQTYRFDILAQKIYEFVWSDYCDWYLELAKVNLQSNNNLDNSINKRGTLQTLLYVLDMILRILHPIMPFITEELWQSLLIFLPTHKCKSIMVADFPIKLINNHENDNSNITPSLAIKPMIKKTIDDITYLQEIVGAVRNLRAEMNILQGQKVPLKIELIDKNQPINDIISFVCALGKISAIEIVKDLSAIEGQSLSPVAILAKVKLMLVVEIDIATEKIRIMRELAKLNLELEKLNQKLDNPQFIQKAPQALVLKEQREHKRLSQNIADFNLQLAKFN
ncbi:MAG: valine--tRNA ligase [Bacteroidia bacterium]|nr:MAG: valine--tRNA ligase [Bacteroidia bacterium]